MFHCRVRATKRTSSGRPADAQRTPSGCPADVIQLVRLVKRRAYSLGRVVKVVRLGSERGFLNGCLGPSVRTKLIRPLCPSRPGRPGRGCELARRKGTLLRENRWRNRRRGRAQQALLRNVQLPRIRQRLLKREAHTTRLRKVPITSGKQANKRSTLRQNKAHHIPLPRRTTKLKATKGVYRRMRKRKIKGVHTKSTKRRAKHFYTKEKQ